MNRRQALQKAWHDKCSGNDSLTNPAYESGFVEGFNAAWDALMAEIRPLVADLQSLTLSESGSGKGMRHFNAVERLRELTSDK